jgi:hypothetical protein
MFPKNEKELKELSKSYFMDIIEKYQKAELENNKELFNKYLKERIVKESKFEALIITDIYNTTYKCSTKNCNTIICNNCLNLVKTNGKNTFEVTDEDLKEEYRLIKCPYCRTTDYTEYMRYSVHWELLMKGINREAIIEDIFKPKFFKNV